MANKYWVYWDTAYNKCSGESTWTKVSERVTHSTLWVGKWMSEWVSNMGIQCWYWKRIPKTFVCSRFDWLFPTEPQEQRVTCLAHELKGKSKESLCSVTFCTQHRLSIIFFLVLFLSTKKIAKNSKSLLHVYGNNNKKTSTTTTLIHIKQYRTFSERMSCEVAKAHETATEQSIAFAVEK